MEEGGFRDMNGNKIRQARAEPSTVMTIENACHCFVAAVPHDDGLRPSVPEQYTNVMHSSLAKLWHHLFRKAAQRRPHLFTRKAAEVGVHPVVRVANGFFGFSDAINTFFRVATDG